MKWFLVVSLVSLLGSGAHGKVNITAHTTSGCSDTVWWIQTHLIPVFRELDPYIDLEIVPWGRTVRGANDTLSCQFGAADCWANRLHRCSLSLLRSSAARAYYIDCEFRSFTDRPAFLEGSYACALASKLEVKDIEACIETARGDELARRAEEAAAVPMADINFVPAIVINGQPILAVHWVAFENLRTVICAIISQDSSIGFTC